MNVYRITWTLTPLSKIRAMRFVCVFFIKKKICASLRFFFQFETVVCHEILFKCVSSVGKADKIVANSFFIYFLFQSPDTQGLKATSRCGLQLFYSRGRCHLLLGLTQGYPFYSPHGSRLGYHQLLMLYVINQRNEIANL